MVNPYSTPNERNASTSRSRHWIARFIVSSWLLVWIASFLFPFVMLGILCTFDQPVSGYQVLLIVIVLFSISLAGVASAIFCSPLNASHRIVGLAVTLLAYPLGFCGFWALLVAIFGVVAP